MYLNAKGVKKQDRYNNTPKRKEENIRNEQLVDLSLCKSPKALVCLEEQTRQDEIKGHPKSEKIILEWIIDIHTVGDVL